MDSFTDWIEIKSNRKKLLYELKTINEDLKNRQGYSEEIIIGQNKWINQFRRENNDRMVRFYLTMRTQTTNIKHIIAACRFSIERLITQIENHSFLYLKKKLVRILIILNQLYQKSRLDYNLYKFLQNLKEILTPFKLEQEFHKIFRIEYYEGVITKSLSSTDLKTVKKVLKKLASMDMGIRGVLLLNKMGKIIEYVIKFSADSKIIENIGKNTSIIYEGNRNFGSIFNLGEFHWASSEFKKEGLFGPESGRVTIFPIGTHMICLIGDYCPNIGGIRMIMKSARNELIKIIE